MQSVSALVPVPSAAAIFADRLVRQSRARSSDRILIVGPCPSDLLPDLYRRGFMEVCQRCGDRLPAHEAFDVLWLLRVGAEPALSGLLAGVGRALRPGGILVARILAPSHRDRSALRVQDIRQRLAACGLVPLTQGTDGAPDGDAGLLLSALRPTADALRWPVTA